MRRHSRLVRVLRLALPAMTVLVVGAIAAMLAFDPRVILAEIDAESMGVTGSTIIMRNPRFTGYEMTPEGKQTGYEVNAARAEQSLANPHEVDLFGIKARMAIREDGWAKLDAGRGHLDNKRETLKLDGSIAIVTDLDDRANLSEADVDFQAGEIVSSKPVRIEFSNAELDAANMHLFSHGDRASFAGGVRMLLKPDTAAPLADSPDRMGNP